MSVSAASEKHVQLVNYSVCITHKCCAIYRATGFCFKLFSDFNALPLINNNSHVYYFQYNFYIGQSHYIVSSYTVLTLLAAIILYSHVILLRISTYLRETDNLFLSLESTTSLDEGSRRQPLLVLPHHQLYT